MKIETCDNIELLKKMKEAAAVQISRINKENALDHANDMQVADIEKELAKINTRLSEIKIN